MSVDARKFWLVWPRVPNEDEAEAEAPDRFEHEGSAVNEAQRRARKAPGTAFYVAEGKAFYVSGDASGALFEESIPF